MGKTVNDDAEQNQTSKSLDLYSDLPEKLRQLEQQHINFLKWLQENEATNNCDTNEENQGISSRIVVPNQDPDQDDMANEWRKHIIKRKYEQNDQSMERR